jgi:hypothetical protein
MVKVMKHEISLVASFVIILFTFVSCFTGTDMSNEDMIRYFQKNYDNFKLLNDNLLILRSKGLRYVNSFDIEPNDLAAINVTEKDIKEIRKQMNRLNLLMVSCQPAFIRYGTYRSGALGGVGKGFEYWTHEPGIFLFGALYKIDEYLSLDDRNKIALDKKYPFQYDIKLNDNWYVFSQNSGP